MSGGWFLKGKNVIIKALEKFVISPGSPVGTPEAGQSYVDPTTHKLKVWSQALGRYITLGDAVDQVFDSSNGRGFIGTSTQSALEELRDHTIYKSTSTATTASGTLTLTTSSTNLQFLTGSASGFAITLPNATLLTAGAHYQLINTSSKVMAVKDGSGALIFNLSQNSIGFLTLRANNTSAGSWVWWQTTYSVASGVVNYNITSSTPFTTSSQTDVIITSFTLTPQAGTYAVWYNASSFYTTTPKVHFWSIYKAGAKVVDTERSQDTAHSNQNMADSTMTILSVDGTQAVDVRVRCANTGSLTVNARTLLLIRLGA